MNIQNKLFSNLNIFMLRVPLLPIESYFNWINSGLSDLEFLKEIYFDKNMSQFFESIKVTSPSLYNTLDKFLNNEKIRDEEYFLDSIFKYFIRSITRCTPFGLFASVNFGNFSKRMTEFILNSSKLKKYVSVDMGWLCGLIKNIEKNNYDKLNYRSNEGLYIKGNRVVLVGVEKKNEKFIFEKNISLNNPLKQILNITRNYTKLNEILSKLQFLIPENNIESLKTYLINLIDNGYLISNITPSLDCKDALSCLIKNLDNLNLDNKCLIEISQLIKKYENEEDFQIAVDTYDSLISKMKSLFISDNYIQIDSQSDFEFVNLNSDFINDLNNLMRILIILNDKNIENNDKWKNYKTRFIEKYGDTREVKLLDLLDENWGLGVPEGYQEEPAEHKTKWLGTIGQGLKEFFFNKFENAIMNKEKAIEIKDSDFENYSFSNIDSVPESLDINLSYVKDKNSNDLFFVGAGVGALRAGSSFGRFSNIMKDSISFFDEINKRSSNENVIHCELRFLPAESRNSNISHCATSSEYEIAVSCGISDSKCKKLALDDIVIGIKDYKFYAKSISNNKLISFTVNNMFNCHNFPAPLRFLWEVTVDHEIPWCLFYWDLFFYHYNYVPEIRYKNFILSPQKWVISWKEFDISKNDNHDFSKFDKKLDKFISNYSVSRFVYFGEFDNRLLLDLKNYRCRKILYSYVAKNERVSLWEYYSNCNQPVRYGSLTYCCELFIPLIKNEINICKNNIASYIPNSEKVRIKIPFDEWISLKIYGSGNQTDNFIINNISCLLKELYNNKIIDKFFFLRYMDPKDHIRLRLNGNSDDLLRGYSIIQYWMKDLIDKKISLNFVIDTYERELERYGGEDLISDIETLFCDSSIAVINLLKIKKSVEITDYQLGLICVTYFIKHFDLSTKEALNLFKISNSKFREQFKKDRNKFMLIVENIMYEKGDLPDKFKNIIRILSHMDNSLSMVSNKIKSKNISQEKYYDILSSLIHMHLNRLFSNNLQVEPVVHAITRHTIYAVHNKMLNIK